MFKIGTFLRAPGNYDPDVVSNETGLACDPDEGVTQQSFKEECDINVIVERFGLTGQLPENLRMPVSGDFTGITDFQTAMQVVRERKRNSCVFRRIFVSGSITIPVS